MGHGSLTTHLDVAQVVLYAFWIFFAGLVYYLVRENHREGYPMDTDRGRTNGWPVPREPKVFNLADGRAVQVPKPRSTQTLNAQPINRMAGAPLEPIGNPLLAGVGPGSWTERFDEAELDLHGKPRIVPLRALPEYGIDGKDPDPRGMEVLGADRKVAGTVKDVWVDTSDALLRYLEVQLSGGVRTVLLPINFARVTRRGGVRVHAIYSHQFADVPSVRHADSVTSLEEEKITAYYGAGMLYADASRAETLL